MDDSAFRQKYEKYKLTVKCWEKEFKLKSGRIPSKYDIKEAPHEIRAAYKMYYKLKTSFLETTLNDVLSDDGYDVAEISQNFSLNESVNDSTAELSSGLTALLSATVINNDFSAVENAPTNETAWDSSVSHQAKTPKQNFAIKKDNNNKNNNLRTSLTNKLIKTASFSKRNPRKSLANTQNNDKTTTTTTTTATTTTNSTDILETLPDLETILTQKAKEKEREKLEALSLPAKETLNTPQLNAAWLQRNTKAALPIKSMETPGAAEKTPIYGLANLNVSQLIKSKSEVPQVEVAAIDSNSDAVVSCSENEAEREQERHIAKKRRLSYKKAPPPPLPAEKPTEKSARKVRAKRKTAVSSEIAAEDQEEAAPDVEQLKCALSLESGVITTVPRIAPQQLKAADDVILEYVNAASGKLNLKRQVNEKSSAAREKLQEKMAAGKLNENFVTINLQKKKFARGKKPMNYSKYKKTLWKQKKRAAALTGPEMDMRGCDGGVMTCYSCGQTGHFAQQCEQKGDQLLALNALENLEEDSEFLTLEEAQRLAANKNAVSKPSQKWKNDEEEEKVEEDENEDDLLHTDDELEQLDIESAVENSLIDKYVGHKIPADFLAKAGLDAASLNAGSKHSAGVTPLFELNKDGSVPSVTAEVMEALKLFGHTNFRKGQDRAIMRILCGQSTLVTLSTGSGKSLCYQLPAYLYSRQKGWITLVISPLVSLMEDQVTGVPHFLRVHCLHTNQTAVQRMKIMESIAQGEVDVLLVSPEAVVAGERSTGFGAILRQLPPIAFACIDEAHCVSQWSHNFRPSYLMICKVLRQNLGVKTLLGLTATATLATRTSIISHLGIPDGMAGVISDIPVPSNLYLSVSRDENRDAALLALLQSERFSQLKSIIIYCTRRDECDRIATFLRTALQDEEFARTKTEDSKKRKRKNINWQAEPYHAGMAASRRRTVQNAFMRNELRLVVATIAFGMGINKPDIRAIIHYNMPRNFESYVQEVGRAGRDGIPAHCHLFLDAQGNDQFELRRHIYANSIDRHVIRKLLQRIFVPCCCAQNTCPGHEIGFSQAETVELLDIPAENISTLLCYLELEPRWRIEVMAAAYTKAKIISYGGAKHLKHASKECPALAMAIALEIKRGTFNPESNIIEFSVIEVAASIGWNSGVVKHQLKNLEWSTVDGRSKRTCLSVAFSDLGFRVRAPGDFTDTEIDDALNTLFERSVQQERSQLMQLQYTFQGLCSVAFQRYVPCTNTEPVVDRSEQLKGIIRDYFENDYPKDLTPIIEESPMPDDQVRNDVLCMVNLYPDNNFSGRNIARIFHGISSPNYPAVMWSRCKFWRAHAKTDFNRILKLANEVIVKHRQ